ncbi:7280_t:CDS:2 [Entrophospora sp. SA101]|nr:7280_t:CDS:2 [Entrophospora sp. SA101]
MLWVQDVCHRFLGSKYDSILKIYMNTTEMEIAFLEMLGNAIDVDLMKIWKNYSKACIHVFRRFYTVKLTESVYLCSNVYINVLPISVSLKT